jgi:broad specificity phosphatase PhoE
MRVALRRVLGRVRQGGHNVHQPFGTTRSTATGGAAHDAVAAEWPVLYHRWRTTPHLMRFPNGESLQELVARAADALRLAIEKHPTEAIVMVGHDSVNRAMLLQALDQPLSAYWRVAQDPCAINEIAVAPDRVTVVRINETAHLRIQV